MILVSKPNVRKEFLSCLNQDRRNGIRKAWYFYHYGTNQLMAIDSDYQFKLSIETYSKQGIHLDRVEPISEEHKKLFGIEEGNLLFFHQKDGKNISNNHCPLAFAFDWMVGTSEWFMVEVKRLSPNKVRTEKDVIPFTHREVEINPNPHGIKEWVFSGGKVYAINEKNALRKAKKLGLVA